MRAALFDLSKKVVIVTGATGHLGKAICGGLAESGSRLAVCSTSDKKAKDLARELTNESGIEAEGFELDLTDLKHIRQTVDRIADRFGRLDCLVNNAYFGSSNDLHSMSLTEWNRGLEGTVTAATFMLQACVRYLEKTEGCVINVSSMYGMVSPDPGLYEGTSYANPVSYGVGKAALLQLTRYAAVHLAPRGIRVNAISPGPFPSPKVQKNKEFIRRLKSKVPLGRIGEPGELCGAVVFLASDAASYVTGHNLVVDGGWTVW